MKFDELDEKMRVYETAHDFCAPPGMHMVARIDGRGFTRLTKELHQFEAPFDIRFRDHMIGTVAHLMDCGFRVIYGYTQSDEISLLFHLAESTFGRKTRKFNSVLAGEASAKFSHLLGDVGAFDCRISLLPNERLVVDYFRWRNEDANRNALNGHCYWALRERGESAGAATKILSGMSTAGKNELLFREKQTNFNELPNWQKRGTGLYWESFEKAGRNPKTGKSTNAIRRRIKVDLELPMKEQYSVFVQDLLRRNSD